MGYFIDLLLLFLTRPAEGMRRIRKRPSVLAALIALLLTGVVDALSFRLLDVVGILKSVGFTSQVTDSIVKVQQASGTFWTFVSEPFFIVMLCVVVIDGVAQLSWKRTAAPSLYTSLSISGLVGAVLRMAGLLMAGIAGGVMLDLCAYGAMVYMLVLGVLAVKSFYEKSTAMAVALYLLPMVLGMGILALLSFIVGGAG